MNTLNERLTQHAIDKHNLRILRTLAADALNAARNPNNHTDLDLIKRHANDLIINPELIAMEDLE